MTSASYYVHHVLAQAILHILFMDSQLTLHKFVTSQQTFRYMNTCHTAYGWVEVQSLHTQYTTFYMSCNIIVHSTSIM